MLLNMTIANFKSVKSPQTISFEAVKDSRLPASKVMAVNDRLNVIKTSAIIGPNGAGKSSFVRALEVLKRIVMAEDVPEGGDKEREDYLAFLRSGGSRSPIKALRVAGVDMASLLPVKAAAEHFGQLLERFRSLRSV